MSRIIWVPKPIALEIHNQCISYFGGASGIRDEGLLESALARASHIHSYDPKASIYDLAAAYCAGICQNHPFLDGNKRTGFVIALSFLKVNEVELKLDQSHVVENMENLAMSLTDEKIIATWFKLNK